MLPFLRYSIVSVLRNRRRSIFAMIGIALALSLMTGSFIAVDSSSYGILRAAIGGVEVDFVGQDYYWANHVDSGRIGSAIAGIESVKYVDRSCPFIYSQGYSMRNPIENTTYWGPWGGGGIAMMRHDDDWVLGRFHINGDMPDLGTVAIPASMASALGLGVGDDILCQVMSSSWDYVNGTYTVLGTYYVNLTYTVSQIWTQERNDQDRYWYGGDLSTNNVIIMNQYDPVFFNIEDGQAIFDSVADIPGSNPVSSTLYYYIWIDRGEVITLADIPGSVNELNFIHGRLEMQGNSLGFSVSDSELVYSLQTLAPQLAVLKVLFLVLSLPVIALGIYLSLVGVDLGITARRREVGMLKSRGASNRQVFGSLMTESLVLGVFASMIGLAAGILVSRFLLGSALSFSSMSSSWSGEWQWTDLRISGNSIVLALFFGITLMFLSTYRPYKRISKTPVAETLHHYSSISTQTRYRPGVDFILLGLSVLSIASVLIGPNAMFDRGWSWITEIIVTVLVLVGIVMFPIMPFFMSVGVIRLLTRGSHKLYAKFTALVRPWTKELTYLVDKNIVRNPRRAANLGVIISLALAFGLFISVTMESSITYEKEVVHFDVGSDIKLSGYSGYGPSEAPGLNYSSLEQIDYLQGVDHVAHFFFLSTFSSYFGGPNTAVLNASEYLDSVDPSNAYFIGHGHGVMDDLEENGTCLLSEEYAKHRAIIEGDVLSFTLQLYRDQNGTYGYDFYTVRVSVIGFVKALPGLDNGEMFIDSGTLDFIPFRNLTAQGTTWGAFIKTSEGADPRDVADRATSVLAAEGVHANAEVLQDRLDELETDPTFGALADFLYMEYALAIVIMSVGVGLIVFVAVNDREHELACIMARGSSSSQMRKILMGESITLMSLGLIVGLSVGILTAYLFNTLYGTESYSVVERHMVFTSVSWIVVIASVVSLLVASLLATVKAGRMKLAEVLRIRGG